MKVLKYVGLFSLGWLILAACTSTVDSSVKTDPKYELPSDIQQAPLKVKEAYQFALVNPELLQQIPCYCGCGGVGHTSNFACYVENIEPAGSVKFDYHAFN
jgi:hypothetical protein